MIQITFDSGVYKIEKDGVDISDIVNKMYIVLEAGKLPRIKAILVSSLLSVDFDDYDWEERE